MYLFLTLPFHLSKGRKRETCKKRKIFFQFNSIQSKLKILKYYN